MNLYNQCLAFTVLNDGYETADLPQIIQEDIAILQCFKNKLDEWSVVLGLLTQIQERINYYNNYRYYDCEIPIVNCDCDCSTYFDYYYANNDEQERVRLDEDLRRLYNDEEDLQLKEYNKKKEILRAKDKIPLRLKDVARKIVKKMDYLLWDWDTRLFT